MPPHEAPDSMKRERRMSTTGFLPNLSAMIPDKRTPTYESIITLYLQIWNFSHESWKKMFEKLVTKHPEK